MPSVFNLSGKVAIITGSTTGIGRSTAELMLAHGASVVISGRPQEACEQTASELRAAEYRVLHMTGQNLVINGGVTTAGG
jgi:NAD(P)-dependent dehydrogenase (short-subunit alcohol dehydrogenase family)